MGGYSISHLASGTCLVSRISQRVATATLATLLPLVDWTQPVISDAALGLVWPLVAKLPRIYKAPRRGIECACGSLRDKGYTCDDFLTGYMCTTVIQTAVIVLECLMAASFRSVRLNCSDFRRESEGERGFRNGWSTTLRVRCPVVPVWTEVKRGSTVTHRGVVEKGLNAEAETS